METPTYTSVTEFYKGKNIFITGASGFLGKVLIEKLLRSCPDIGNIYILMRPKRSKDIHQRTEDILKLKLFEKLHKNQPHFGEKIIPINGDIALQDVGLSETDKNLLEDEVDVIFHSAATIRFDEPLRLSTDLNVVGVRRMVELSKRMKHLKVFIHVSTAYSNCDRPIIEETVYPTSVDPQKLIDMLDWLDDDLVDHMTPKLIGDKPNTYTFTKQLGEVLLMKEGAGLPIAIVRPSIVGAAWKEPLPGWIDNFNGPSGLYIATGKGILRSMKGDHNAVADIIPVDISVNLMITSAWYTAMHKPEQMLVYHNTVGHINPLTWGTMQHIVLNTFKHMPLEDCFQRPNASLTRSSLMNEYWTFVGQFIPAHSVDLVCRLIGKRPRMVAIHNKLYKATNALTYFTSNSWEWSYNNLDILKDKLNTEDAKTFYFDPRPLHWPTYVKNYCMGAKEFVLKEDMSRIPAAQAHIRRLRNMWYMFSTILAISFWRMLIVRSHIARNIWYFLVNLVFKFVRFFRITSTMQK